MRNAVIFSGVPPRLTIASLSAAQTVIIAAQVFGGLQDHSARPVVLGDQVDVRSACRDHHRLVERLADHGGGDAIRVEIVGVDEVEIVAVGDQSARSLEAGARQAGRGAVHADLGQQQVARVFDADAVALFVDRYGGVLGILAEARVLEGKPGHGSNYTGFNFTTRQQMTQASLDENAVAGAHTAGVERGEKQRADHDFAEIASACLDRASGVTNLRHRSPRNSS